LLLIGPSSWKFDYVALAGFAEMQGAILITLHKHVLGVIAGSWMVLKLSWRDSFGANVGEEPMKIDICGG
jgi:hypothetical protein